MRGMSEKDDYITRLEARNAYLEARIAELEDEIEKQKSAWRQIALEVAKGTIKSDPVRDAVNSLAVWLKGEKQRPAEAIITPPPDPNRPDSD